MTLHQQHLEEIFVILGGRPENLQAAAACSEISKEYAKGFVIWRDELSWKDSNLVDDNGNITVKTLDQLLSLYDDHLAKLEKEKKK